MLGINTDFSLRMAVVAIFLVLGFEVAGLAPAMFIATYGSSDNSSLLKVSDKNVSGTENGNVTTKGNVFLNQTKDTAGNQTVLAINSSNTTSANGSNAKILTNASRATASAFAAITWLIACTISIATTTTTSPYNNNYHLYNHHLTLSHPDHHRNNKIPFRSCNLHSNCPHL